MRRRRLVPALVVLAVLTSGSTVAACGGSEEPAGTVTNAITIGTGTQATSPGGGEAGAEPAEEGGAGDTGQTTGAEAGADANENPGDPAAGKEVFLGVGGCGSCHTFADAGTSGSIGPNLDDAAPSLDLALDRITNGQGAMPSFSGQLTDQQIADVAAYVSG